MIDSYAQSDTGAMIVHLRKRLRSMGMLLARFDADGSLRGRRGRTKDWLWSLLFRSPLFTRAVQDAVRTWNSEDEPAPIEVVPGCFACPNPVMARRTRDGYTVTVIPTEDLIGSEHLAAMCQASMADMQLIRSRLMSLPPARRDEIGRLSELVRWLQEDYLQLISEDHAMQSVGQQLAESYEEINLLYTIIQNMIVRERPERFIAKTCDELLQTLPYGWIAAQLADEAVRLPRLRGRLVVSGEPPVPVEELRMMTRQLIARDEACKPHVYGAEFARQDALFEELGVPLIQQPVTNGERLMGVLLAGRKTGPDGDASSSDLKLLGAAASHVAIFLENASLYEDLNGMFLGTLEALTSSIDAKDKYTCGHSRRVADLTRQLALAIDLDEHTANRMHIAGLVHDVGKIGVPEAVLTKAGRLTEEEFAWIREHPSIGYRILKDIPQLEDVLPGVLHHHERWDGGGYPSGLKANEIPLVARLIALADTFDAMSSTRTYRCAMERDCVLEEMLRCGGTQFDPDIVGVFVDLDFAAYDRLVAHHQAAEQRPAEQPLPQRASDMTGDAREKGTAA